MAKKEKAKPVKIDTVQKKKPASAPTSHRKAARSQTNGGAAGKSSRKGERSTNGGNGSESRQKLTRRDLIKTRHEAMRREIEQIREDLESDEEE